MKCIETLVNNIYTSYKIPFQLIIDEIGEYSSPEFDSLQDNKEKIFNYEDTKCCIKVNAAFSVVIDLLEFCIVSKLREVFMQKKKIISMLLKGEQVDKELITVGWQALTKEFNIVNIYVQNYSDEVLSYIEEGYRDSSIEVILIDDTILMIGEFEDVLEHVISIRETINNSVLGKCYISYCTVNNYLDLKKSYEDSIYKIKLAQKYNIVESIFDEKKLILEGIIDSVSEDTKNEIFNNFDEGMSSLDGEMVKTIEVFFKCGLNLSEAAKDLYIHRNTLIYRLDKIQKYTGYDIRDFNSAILFKIVFFIWREKKQVRN